MDFISPFIDPIIQYVMEPVKKHIGFFVSSTKLAKTMRERMQKLNIIALEMQNKKGEADENNQEVSLLVSPWLEEFKETDEKARSVPTGGIGCYNMAERYKAGKRSSDIIEKINDLETQESKIKWTNKQVPLDKVSSNSASFHDDTQKSFGSRNDVFKAALESLQQDNETRNMIALCGMGGVGKTTMMEELEKAVKESKMFDRVVKVVIGKTSDPIPIQQAIAEYMGDGLIGTIKDIRAERLRNKFRWISESEKEKVLVIMDDIWTEVDLKDIGLTRPLPHGFKLLLTSRFENVCTQMGVNKDSIFQIQTLNEVEAKELFFDTVGSSGLDDNDPELPKIGEEIVKKCGGLPIAIVTIAKSLRGEKKEVWVDALHRLKDQDFQDFDGIGHKVFAMSYDNLKNDEAKKVLFLSGVFPDDFNIPIEDLMRYGWGLKLFKDVHSIADARRRTNTCVRKLIQANLLTESYPVGYVKMHNLVRAFALSTYSKVKQASLVYHDDMSRQLTKCPSDSVERILMNCTNMKEFPSEFNYPNLSFFMLMDGDKQLKFPPDFYGRMNKLEVVSYERMHSPLLPIIFEDATKLRTLCLRSCSLMDDLSFIGCLINLETLSFANCNIRKLPSTIGKLINLRLLDLTGCDDLRIDDGGSLKNLVSLEELYMRAYEWKVNKFIEIKGGELESSGNKVLVKNVSFTKLERFSISIGWVPTIVDEYKDPLKNTIRLVADYNELVECDIIEIFEKTEDLFLQVVKTDHLRDLSAYSFCNLTVLKLDKCPDLRYLFTFEVATGMKKLEHLTVIWCPLLDMLVDMGAQTNRALFPRLEFLYLCALPCLKHIGGGYASHNQFQSTQVIGASWSLYQYPREITIFNCPALLSSPIQCYVLLKDLKPSISLLQLKKLEKVKLFNFELVEEVFEVILEGTDKGNNSGFSGSQTVVEIPNLIDLELYWMNNLKHLWNSKRRMVLEFPKLTWVSIHSCKRLEHVFTCSMVGSLVHLQVLHIFKCENLEVIVKEEEQEYDVKVNKIRLLHLNRIFLSGLPILEGFCLGKHAFSLPKLDTLIIMNSPKVTLFTKGQLDTPELKVIYTNFGECEVKEDLNSFLYSKQNEGKTV